MTQPEHAVFRTRGQNRALYNASLINVCRQLRLTSQIRFSAKITEISHLNQKIVNPYTPVAQNVADEVVFRHFQGEEFEFF